MTTSIINTKTKKSYLKHHKKCFYCGAKATTIDHVIPCQVFEMTVDYEDEYRSCIRDQENWRPSCKSCNTKRLAHFDRSNVPHSLLNKYSSMVDEYLNARHEVLESQNGKCAKCGHPIHDIDAVLLYKRKATGVELNGKNCIAICYNCDEIRNREKESKIPKHNNTN